VISGQPSVDYTAGSWLHASGILLYGEVIGIVNEIVQMNKKNDWLRGIRKRYFLSSSKDDEIRAAF
jgi:hypothetical protein